MARIGLFGGSFNPIHNGHINLARTVKSKAGLDKIILIPSGTAPHKSSDEYAVAEDRLNMCCLAAEDIPGFEVSDFEIKRVGKSYSIYTVEHFKWLYPNDELFLLVGSDMLLSFEKWFEYKKILECVTLIAASRTGDDFEALEKTAEKIKQYGKVIVVNDNTFPMSSTNIRKLIKNNEDLSCYLNGKVVKYIILKKIYMENQGYAD